MSANTFKIRMLDGSYEDSEPVVGKWYVAATEEKDGINYGAIGEYASEGEFDDEGSDVTESMRDCDYLQLQR